jgi:hypothetical protein
MRNGCMYESYKPAGVSQWLRPSGMNHAGLGPGLGLGVEDSGQAEAAEACDCCDDDIEDCAVVAGDERDRFDDY